MTLLEQLEQELERVRKHLKRLTREQSVLTEQITRLRTGARPEVVCAALEVAFGVRLDLYLLASEGADGRSTFSDRQKAAASSSERWRPPERRAELSRRWLSHSALWKITPRLYRRPDTTRLTPCRSVAR